MGRKTAEEILDEHLDSLSWDKNNPELLAMYCRSKDAINQARKDMIVECCNKIKTYKIGNSGSWLDAAPDRSILINLIYELK